LLLPALLAGPTQRLTLLLLLLPPPLLPLSVHAGDDMEEPHSQDEEAHTADQQEHARPAKRARSGVTGAAAAAPSAAAQPAVMV
jgi:hypothetical protein